MAKPSSRAELITYCKRQLGEPVLQINIDDEQVNNVIDDTIQFFQENCYNGMERIYLKHRITAEDIERFKSNSTSLVDSNNNTSQINSTAKTIITSKIKEISSTSQETIDSFDILETKSAEYLIEITQGNSYQTSKIILIHDNTTPAITEYATILSDSKLGIIDAEISNGVVKLLVQMFSADDATVKINRTSMYNQTQTFTGGSTLWQNATNYIPIPDHVIGITKVFGLVSNSIRSNLWGIEYQLYLNDLYAFGSLDILNYFMTKQYLETLDMVLNNGSFQQFRYTMRRDRLYLDVDADFLAEGKYLLIEAHRMIDPNDATEMYNDMFVKRYATALMKKQWGQNLIKYNNVQLPGGITLNGRQLYEDAIGEIATIEGEVLSKYAIPPMDFIG